MLIVRWPFRTLKDKKRTNLRMDLRKLSGWCSKLWARLRAPISWICVYADTAWVLSCLWRSLRDRFDSSSCFLNINVRPKPHLFLVRGGTAAYKKARTNLPSLAGVYWSTFQSASPIDQRLPPVNVTRGHDDQRYASIRDHLMVYSTTLSMHISGALTINATPASKSYPWLLWRNIEGVTNYRQALWTRCIQCWFAHISIRKC